MSRSTMLHISMLEPHPGNIRDDIGDVSDEARSILAHGILQPLIVIPREGRSGHYWIVAGSRRYHAAKRARQDQVPVIIRRDDLTPAQVTEIMLVENCQRADLNPIEKARAFGRLRKAGRTSADIARSVGISEATVSYFLTLLELDESSQRRIVTGALPVGVAVAGVRSTRKAQRKSAGHKPHGVTWEPDHFTDKHALARSARAMCEARGHTARRRLGRVACGQCWETAIRDDERTVAAVYLQQGGSLFPPKGDASSIFKPPVVANGSAS